mgnify:CR=1 FL=1
MAERRKRAFRVLLVLNGFLKIWNSEPWYSVAPNCCRKCSLSATTRKFDVVVLGAGAAGLMCALTAGQRGRSVLVLEKANKAGKKILMSGGGRCNFTNYVIEPANYLSENPHFCISALKRYTQWDFIALVERYAIAYEERKHGQLFCLDSAKDILDMLLAECAEAGVRIETHCNNLEVPTEINGARTLHYERHGQLEAVVCDSLVVATGALSIPTLGGSDLGYVLAQNLGIPLIPRRAGLVPFMFSDATKALCERLSGLALDVEVSCAGQSFRENMLFTHRGISGPSILQISNYWHPGDRLTINLLPDLDVMTWLQAKKLSDGRSLLRTQLAQVLPKSLVAELQSLWWQEAADKPLAEISDETLGGIANKLAVWSLKPSATEGYRTAEVTLGGVDTNAISSKTFEAKAVPGLYFVGEVLDVTGHLGGFNFQWAWSSGYCAGSYV